MSKRSLKFCVGLLVGLVCIITEGTYAESWRGCERQRTAKFRTERCVVPQKQGPILNHTPDDNLIVASMNGVDSRLAKYWWVDSAAFADSINSFENGHLSRQLWRKLLFYCSKVLDSNVRALKVVTPHSNRSMVGWQVPLILNRDTKGRAFVDSEIGYSIRNGDDISPQRNVRQKCQEACKQREQQIRCLFIGESFPEPEETGPERTDSFTNATFHWTCFIVLPILFVTAFTCAAVYKNLLPTICGWVLMGLWWLWFVG